MKILLLVAMATSLSGCAGLAEYAKAAGTNSDNWCAALSSPYGGGVAGSIKTPGSKLTLSGSSCSLETGKQ